MNRNIVLLLDSDEQQATMRLAHETEKAGRVFIALELSLAALNSLFSALRFFKRDK